MTPAMTPAIDDLKQTIENMKETAANQKLEIQRLRLDVAKGHNWLWDQLAAMQVKKVNISNDY
jgi:hypothetical protein